MTLTTKKSRISSEWSTRLPKTSFLVRLTLFKFLLEAKLAQALQPIRLRLWLSAVLLLLTLSALTQASQPAPTSCWLGRKPLLSALQLSPMKSLRNKMLMVVFNGLLNNHSLLTTFGLRKMLVFASNMNSPLLLRIRSADHLFQTCTNWKLLKNLTDQLWKHVHSMLQLNSLLSSGINLTLLVVLP